MRSQRISGSGPKRESNLGPRYPLRQTSDPDEITKAPRRPLRKESKETDISDASAKTV